MDSVAEDFEEVQLPVDITVSSYETLLILMKSNEAGVLMPTISALREQIEDESIVTQIIDRLVELASTFQNDQVQIVISWYFAALAKNSCTSKWGFNLLSKSGAIPHIVKYAKSFDTPSLSERCFDALVSLSADSVTSREIISNGALEVFKEALSNDDSTIQSQVSLALFQMSDDFENKRAIYTSGLFESLIEFLKNEDIDEEVLINVLRAIGNLLSDSECSILFEEKLGWNNVLPYLDDSDKTIQTYSYMIISQISNFKLFKYHFDDELLQRFIDTLNDIEETDPIMPYLLTIFKNNCSLPIVSKNLSQQVPLLLDRVYSTQTDPQIKIITAEIIRELSADTSTHSTILEPEQLNRICQLLGKTFTSNDGTIINNNRSIRRSIMHVIEYICDNRSIRAKLHEFGAIEHLINILKETVTFDNDDNDDKGWRIEFQMIVLPIFSRMIGDSKLQQMLIENSLGDFEILLTSEYPDIINTTLILIATLAVNDLTKTYVSNHVNFIQILIQLISNKKVAIRRNSLHAINTLSMMTSVSTQFCSYGLLEKLKRFASSTAMINLNLSTFATNALETICKSNLIAKYWIKDFLDFNDIISDGFYSIDPRCETYKSLDDLLKDVIHLRMEAILIDKNKDNGLNEAINLLEESFTVKNEPVEQNQTKKKGAKKVEQQIEPQIVKVVPEWPLIAESIAKFVVNRMGGPFENGRIAYESEVSRCKYQTHSDVIMIGQLKVGAIRHRALLFKYLAQMYGIEASVKRNRNDLSCEVRVKKGNEVFNVSLDKINEILTPSNNN
ncbi:armadillo repeat-containing protein 3 [Histomonas meleagridis]|uniref:armadillo repeat-containing protein 3 n=1 Tax=Histomonas meleagridis TaxID=135588 RepID=UPI00355A3C39|nr:armadillo repeat-containing protein 3 [Histomonas meleagridis]KAH0805010.1 armadillo repeat-containing protein 3 [Histomonas meleagridis]